MKKYDVIIAGAGPGGAVAAGLFAKAGFSTLLIEKRRTPGVPVRCAEAAGLKADLERFIDMDGPWFAGIVRSGYLVSPSGTRAKGELEGEGVMVHRDLFDQALVDKAVDKGAEIWTASQVMDVQINKRDVRLEVMSNDETMEVRTRFFVAADGVEGTMARCLGLNNSFAPEDILTCYEYNLSGRVLDIDEGSLYFFLGNQRAPGGYAWIFPKNDGTYNVGVGISYQASKKRKAGFYLKKFVKDYFEEYEINREIAGGVPIPGNKLKKITRRAVLLGDAAGHCNPLSGGGIINAMEAAEILFDSVEMKLRIDSLEADDLKKYEEAWNRKNGRKIDVYYAMKNSFFVSSDEEYDSFVLSLSKIIEKKKKKMGVSHVISLFIMVLVKNFPLGGRFLIALLKFKMKSSP